MRRNEQIQQTVKLLEQLDIKDVVVIKLDVDPSLLTKEEKGVVTKEEWIIFPTNGANIVYRREK